MLQAIKRFFGKNNGTDEPEITTVPRDQHPISRKQISENALKVLYRLNKHDHEAYLVGGGVRDIMVGIQPKDFDIVTDATPEEVRALFRNSRIIGRRFKIVHVVFGREVIEVATFRAGAEDAKERGEGDAHRRSDSGMLLRDNVYGTLEEDIVRRDFTINAMYYTTHDFSLVTLAESLDDLDDRQIRMIGDPVQRYREDPVRMLRAVRFAAKLDFDIEPATAAPIPKMADLLDNIPAARLFDDVLKLFMSGYGVRTYERLQQYGLFRHLFPHTQASLDQDDSGHYERLILGALKSTDERIELGKSVTPAFIYAAFLWPVVEAQTEINLNSGTPPVPAQQQAIQEAISLQGQRTSIPKRFQFTMRDIWELQPRLPNRQGNRAERLVTHPKFRAAFDFLLLREQAGADLDGLGQWWEDYQNADDEQRQQMVSALGGQRRRSSNRRPRRRNRPTL
ncbi:polynucleotide adenylyltransferase PcnB [Natronospirillum operosum]|uniref:Poly(A) polymerase I n=1 Tax=Natronospirillum operosum TaxID=2759953 RepID=A0A4Z0WC39_9GAMM|nr:polynucleotide adenylyltransferase PcnB [Natronospirillum operosum]TGG94105.1 polynucleotide adenylyltransferase PcnB [Natronospirillum operosum]